MLYLALLCPRVLSNNAIIYDAPWPRVYFTRATCGRVVSDGPRTDAREFFKRTPSAKFERYGYVREKNYRASYENADSWDKTTERQ